MTQTINRQAKVKMTIIIIIIKSNYDYK
jgi:hypothetical protein